MSRPLARSLSKPTFQSDFIGIYLCSSVFICGSNSQIWIFAKPPLDQLLAQLNRDFAMPLLAQCERVVQRDGVTTAEEAKVIEKISKKFEIDLNAMKTQL